jgi:hypothetical protein
MLSSIEVAIVDQADVFLMQNWDHVMVRVVGTALHAGHGCNTPPSTPPPRRQLALPFLSLGTNAPLSPSPLLNSTCLTQDTWPH